MTVDFDPAKDRINRRKHHISLSRAADFDFDTAAYVHDTRHDYGEPRYIAIGFLDALLHVLVFVPQTETSIRAITLRKADKREMRKYAEED